MTQRISDEDGINAGTRNVGRFFLALIPWALGIAFAVWLGVWIGIHEYRHELSQESRAAQYVGAEERPKAKLKIDAVHHDCSVITKADVDGTTLMIYAKSNCPKELDYFAWHWQLLSPNGTVISAGQDNWRCPRPIRRGDVAECKMEISDDDRGDTLRIWTSINVD